MFFHTVFHGTFGFSPTILGSWMDSLRKSCILAAEGFCLRRSGTYGIVLARIFKQGYSAGTAARFGGLPRALENVDANGVNSMSLMNLLTRSALHLYFGRCRFRPPLLTGNASCSIAILVGYRSQMKVPIWDVIRAIAEFGMLITEAKNHKREVMNVFNTITF